jgi:two-component system sensor histidine kinase/response regulator
MANERISQQNTELVETNALKDKFLQIATHDIRNPLTTINACIFSLRKAAARGNFERIDETLNMIERATGRMGGLVSDFLDFREIRSGNCKIEPQHCNLNELICNLIEEYQDYAVRKSIGMQFVPDKTLPECNIDWNRTSQIASNFISNAIKFTPQGGSVSVRTIAQSGSVRTEIRDSGPGVPAEERELLFREFARLSPRPTGDEKSSGLGLSIVKHLVEMQGGKVGAEFPADGGSIFWFELPVGS